MLKMLKRLLLGSASQAPVLTRARTRDNAFLYRMPAGIPGDVNRAFAALVEPNQIDDSDPPLAYGVPVALDTVTGEIRPIGAGDTAVDLYGVLVRPFPIQVTTAATYMGGQPLTDPASGVPPAAGMCDVLKSGYMTVRLYGATAATRGGAVYTRIANAGAGEVVGGFEAAADGGDTIQAGARNTTYFRGPADANGNVEIAWNL